MQADIQILGWGERNARVPAKGFIIARKGCFRINRVTKDDDSNCVTVQFGIGSLVIKAATN